MEFIELLTRVWMEDQKRERDREDWTRKREARQWPDSELKEMDENRTTPQPARPTPPRPPPKPDRLRNEASAKTSPTYSPEISTVLEQMAERLGSLSKTYRGQGSENCVTDSPMPSMPPNYSYIFGSSTASETKVKQPVPDDSKPRDSASSLASTGQDSTPVKLSVSRQGSREGEILTTEEKTELMETIQRLTEEQQTLKERISEHDERLLSLITKKPSVRRRMTSKARTLFGHQDLMFPADVFNTSGGGPLNQFTREEDTIDAQIENLYANLCRIHFPAQQKTITQCLAANVSQQRFAAGTSELALYQENIQLKEKISRLEDRLKEMSETNRDKTDAATNNDIESLKMDAIYDECRSTGYQNTTSIDLMTTDNNIPTSPCPYQILKRDVQQVSTTFEWSITNYCEKLEMEKRGKIANTVSEPFCIGHCGHVAQLEVYLNGNVGGKNKFMSIFMRVIKGEYDDFLQWPAIFSLTFILINQEDNMNGSLMFRDDKTVFRYKKPSSIDSNEENTWGLLEFVSHETIKGKKYIKDDTIKLRIDLLK